MEGVPFSPAFDPASLTREELIAYYSIRGFAVQDIRLLLRYIHGHAISKRQLIRIRKQLGVNTRRNESELSNIIGAIQEELHGAGSSLGYRSMWMRLVHTHHLAVRRDTVMMLLHILDPQGTEQRGRRLRRRVYRSKGPNFIWHCDGYDKLKPYGIAIHGCIDGFSRRIMWMKAGRTNNDASVIAQYYLDCVETIGGCPRLLRADRGTENALISFIQPTFRHAHQDSMSGIRSFQYGRSTANQRIESWWSFLRVQMTDWWISFFKDLQTYGFFDNSVSYHIDAIRYSFGPLIQEELNRVITEWNYHRVRPSSMAEAPAGIPEVLYHLPELEGAEDHKFIVHNQLLQDAKEMYGFAGNVIVDEEFAAYAEEVVNTNQIAYPPSKAVTTMKH